MKKIALLLALILMVVVAVTGYEQLRRQELLGNLSSETTAIAAGYKTITDRDLTPLVASQALTKTQSGAVHEIAAQFATLPHAPSLAAKVTAIHAIQLAIVSFLRDTGPDQPFATSTQLADLQKEMGKDGDMRGLLDAYNQSAQEWNSLQSDRASMLTSNLLQKNNNLLPYLRFDGQLEYFTVIHL